MSEIIQHQLKGAAILEDSMTPSTSNRTVEHDPFIKSRLASQHSV